MTLAGFPRITVDPAICGGRPVVAGTRVRVSDIWARFAGGASAAEIAGDFPYLGEDDIRAALAFAAGKELRSLRGRLDWQGDLDAMRRD